VGIETVVAESRGQGYARHMALQWGRWLLLIVEMVCMREVTP
jgi:predicted anti-sigma-YlaC factor YlaD